jgi:hypothetical protein
MGRGVGARGLAASEAKNPKTPPADQKTPKPQKPQTGAEDEAFKQN